MKILRSAVLWIAGIIVFFLLWSLFQTTKPRQELIAFSTFLDRVSEGAVERVFIRGNEAVAVTRPTAAGGRRDLRTVVPASYPAMYDLMRAKGVVIELEDAGQPTLLAALITWAPVLVIIGAWLWFLRRATRRREQSSANGPSPTANH